MAKTRPYSVAFRGTNRMVIATSQSTARRHIIADAMRKIDQDITVEAAGGIAVAEFVNSGGKIETAGVFVDPEPAGDGVEQARRLLGGHQPEDSDAGAPPSGGSGADESDVKK